MSKKVGRVTNLYNKAKNQLKENQLEDARDTLDICLLVLAMETERGLEIIDNVKTDLWKDRIWLLLEEKQLLY
jgi:hypothetical protein